MADVMRMIRRSRTDASLDNNFGASLGKSLATHQVLPAVSSALSGMTSNLPRVRAPNLLLSGTGGLMRDIAVGHNAFDLKHRVMNHSFKDGRVISKKHGHKNTLIRPAHGIKSGGH